MKLSARSHYKTIRIARSISDLEGYRNIEEEHIMESLTYINNLDSKKY